MSSNTLEKSRRRNASHCDSLPIGEVKPSPENDQLYHPINPADAEFIELVESVRTQGILDPLIVTADRWIVSGHRRHAAAIAAGLEVVPARILAIRRADDPDGFIRLLREHNRQRVKTFDERLREELVSIDPADAYEHLKEHRQRKLDHDRVSGAKIDAGDFKGRCAISAAKWPMLRAIVKIIEDCRDFWPLSDRQIHYRLLNAPPLIHTSKPASLYRNDLPSYRALTDLLTRARLAGNVPWDAIADETRSFTAWATWKEPGAFIRQQAGDFLKGYWRDLMQSQPAHIEIVAEKLTVKSIVERIAQEFCIPVTVGRGFCSIQPRHALAQRFKTSGRDRLALLILTDHDPEGESIAKSFTRSMRDDFGIAEDRIHAVKVALNAEQVARFNLPPSMKAKKSSSRFKSFQRKYGNFAWELEALTPDTLANELRKAIEGVIDGEAFEHERQQEARDARQLEATRAATLKAMPGIAGE